MAIIDEKSVLILGAGASVPFSMPGGGDLMARIENNIRSEISSVTENNGIHDTLNLYKINQAISYSPSFLTVPTVASLISFEADRLQADINSVAGSTLEKAKSFSQELRSQASETIDDFISLNPEHANYAKICIATEFAKCLYGKIGATWVSSLGANERNTPPELRDLSRRNILIGERIPSLKNRNWVHLFISIVRAGIAQNKVSPQNKIKVITFNYDMILEYVLDQQFGNIGDKDRFLDWREYIEIVHPHGKCGELTPVLKDPTETILKWAEGIFVVNEPGENVPETTKMDRKKAQDWIAAATEIYVCGFSFSLPNCDLLGLHAAQDLGFDRLISYCNYDGNPGLTHIVERFGHKQIKRRVATVAVGSNFAQNREELSYNTTIQEASPSGIEPKGIAEWFHQGFPGAMPG